MEDKSNLIRLEHKVGSSTLYADKMMNNRKEEKLGRLVQEGQYANNELQKKGTQEMGGFTIGMVQDNVPKLKA